MQKNRQGMIACLMLIIGLITPFCASADNIKQKIEHILAQADPSVNVGIKIKRMDTDTTLYSKNAQRTFIPASTLKIFSAVTALIQLGPDYQYKTQVYSDNTDINNGVLNGNLYYRFTGNPSLSKFDLEELVIALKHRGIHKINGDVYLDGHSYDTMKLGPGWMWDDAHFCYSAPLSSITLNHNCFQVRAITSRRANAPIAVKTLNYEPYLSVISKATMQKRKDCELRVKSNPKNQYVISGCLPLYTNSKIMDISITNPQQYVKDVLKDLFARQQITLGGKIKIGKTSASAKRIAQHKSEPLSMLVADMLKESDNLIANALFKTIGAKYFKRQGTWRNGAKAMRKILKNDVKINVRKLSIVDGAGLSRYNLISPEHLVQLLQYAYHNFDISPELMAALPIAGKDGTLESRMQQSDVRGKVRAKTGSMKNVSSLAGYVISKNKKILAFTIIFNGITTEPISKYHHLEDKICRYLAKTNV